MEFTHDYARYGKPAPLRRTTLIVKETSKVIAFPSVVSRGTHHAISEARRMKKTVAVVNI